MAASSKWTRLEDVPTDVFMKPERMNVHEFVIADERNGGKLHKYNVKLNAWKEIDFGMKSGRKWSEL